MKGVNSKKTSAIRQFNANIAIVIEMTLNNPFAIFKKTVQKSFIVSVSFVTLETTVPAGVWSKYRIPNETTFSYNWFRMFATVLSEAVLNRKSFAYEKMALRRVSTP